MRIALNYHANYYYFIKRILTFRTLPSIECGRGSITSWPEHRAKYLDDNFLLCTCAQLPKFLVWGISGMRTFIYSTIYYIQEDKIAVCAPLPMMLPCKGRFRCKTEEKSNYYAHAPTRDISVAPLITAAKASHLLLPFRIP